MKGDIDETNILVNNNTKSKEKINIYKMLKLVNSGNFNLQDTSDFNYYDLITNKNNNIILDNLLFYVYQLMIYSILVTISIVMILITKELSTSEHPLFIIIAYGLSLVITSILSNFYSLREAVLNNRIKIYFYNKIINLPQNNNFMENIQIDIPNLAYFYAILPKILLMPILVLYYLFELYSQFGQKIIIYYFLSVIVEYIVSIKMMDYTILFKKHKSDRIRYLTSIFDNLREVKIINKTFFFYNKMREIKINENYYNSLVLLWDILLEMKCKYIPIILSLVIYYDNLNEFNISSYIIGLNIIKNLCGNMSVLPDLLKSYYNYNTSYKRIFNNSTNEAAYSLNINNRIIELLNVIENNNNDIFIQGKMGVGKSQFLIQIAKFQSLSKKTLISSYCLIIKGSLVDNIIFDNCLDEELLMKTLELVCLTEEIDKNYIIEENGVNLSEGQKRRVCIGRELYNIYLNHRGHKNIFLLDDAFDSIDNITSSKIYRNIQNIKKDFLSINLIMSSTSNFRCFIEMKPINSHFFILNENFELKQQEYIGECNNKLEENLDIAKITNLKHKNSNTKSSSDSKYTSVYLLIMRLLIKNELLLTKVVFMFITCSLIQIISFYSDYLLNNEMFMSNLIFLQLLLFFIQSSLLIKGTIILSDILNDQMFYSLISDNSTTSKFSTGELIQRFTTEIDKVSKNLQILLLSYTNLLQLVSLLIMSSIIYRIFLLFIPIFALLTYFTVKYYNKINKQLKNLDSKARSTFLSEVNLFHNAFKHLFITSDSRLAYFHKLLNDKMNTLIVVNYLSWIVFTLFDFVFDLFGLFINLSILVVFYSSSDVSIIVIIYVITTISIISSNMKLCIKKFTIFEGHLVGYTRCLEVIDNSMSNENEIILKSKEEDLNSNLLEFRNVSFSYCKSTKLLFNLNFLIEKNSIIKISGKTGSGKTTMINLIFNFLKPTNGNIIRNIEYDLISYVSQCSYIFNNSNLIENLLFSKETGLIKEANIVLLINFAQIKLKQNLDSIINENSLSQGEKQLICIIRATINWINKGGLLILDEATSHFDKETEEIIFKIILYYSQRNNRAVVFTSHKEEINHFLKPTIIINVES